MAAHPTEFNDFAWTREYARDYSAKIINHSKMKVLKDIKKIISALGQATINEFRTTCFGHMLDFDDEATISAVIMHQIIARQFTFAGVGPHEAWFRIREQSIRFSKVEFCLVTGLKFGDSTFDPNAEHVVGDNSLWRTIFGSRTVQVDTLAQNFTNGIYSNDPTIAIKVALIIIAELILMGVDYRSCVKLWIWTLVEDRARWNSFPWGKYAFQMTLHYLNKVPSPPQSTSGGKLSYHMYGFPLALQIWAIEAIPELGTLFFTKTTYEIPRFRKWKMSKKSIVLGDAFTRNLECERTLVAMEEERRQEYWHDIDANIMEGIQWLPPVDPFPLRSSMISTVRGQKRRMTNFDVTPLSTQIDVGVIPHPNAGVIEPLARGVTPPSAPRTSLPPTPRLSRPAAPSWARRDKVSTRKLRAVMREELPRILQDTLPGILASILPDVLRQIREQEAIKEPGVNIEES
ncbi:hypothetical protein DITRI_Ditri15bG0043100 [Diplodiscus trichospermus]